MLDTMGGAPSHRDAARGEDVWHGEWITCRAKIKIDEWRRSIVEGKGRHVERRGGIKGAWGLSKMGRCGGLERRTATAIKMTL